MDFAQYLDKKKSIQELFIEYLDNEKSEESDSQLLGFDFFDDLKDEEKKYRLKEIFHLLMELTNNHHRTPNFYDKIDTIILHFKDDLTKYYTNYEIFTIFQNNNRILYFLLNQKILVFDKQLLNIFNNQDCYQFYFIQEVASFYDEESIKNDDSAELQNKFELFEENRLAGENDSVLCQYIRTDSIDDFIVYVNKTNISLNRKINHSIFETNSYLIDNEPTIIEYAAFFGSIQVFNYLRTNGVNLTPSLWTYVIHSDNAELVQILEDNNIQPIEKNFVECYHEAIKCHHNNVAIYIHDNLLKKEDKNTNSLIIASYNFALFGAFSNRLSDFIGYDYVELISMVLQKENVNVNEKRYNVFFFN